MAFTVGRTFVVDSDNQKPHLRNKQVYQVLQMPDPRKLEVNLSQLSPEAQKAMNMGQEDTKDNRTLGKHITRSDPVNIHDNNNGSGNKVLLHNTKIVRHVKNSKLDSKAVSLNSVGSRMHVSSRSRNTTTSSFDASALTATSRSRSTLSLTDRNYSISDNNDSCCNFNNRIKAMNDIINNHDIKNSNTENINNTHQSKPQEFQKQLHNYDNDYINENNDNINDDEVIKEHEQCAQSQSFVLALDRILEENCISRLKGDITNSKRVSEHGQVRALDGGRLTNAQEIVVNVCHDDNRELVFHDDDEESLNNAKAISEIRISLWMKYNEVFQPEDMIEDIDTQLTEDGSGKLGGVREVGPPTQRRNTAKAPNELKVHSQGSYKSKTISTNSNKNRLQTIKKDFNNNGTTLKLKSNSLRDLKSTKSAFKQHSKSFQ